MISLSELIADDPSLKPANPHELEMIHVVTSDQKLFLKYRDANLVDKIKKIVPVTELTNKCRERMLEIQSANSAAASTTEGSNNQIKLESNDVFFLILLEWFKNDFFTWYDCGYCDKCKKPMVLAGRSPPTKDDTRWDAAAIEIYRCNDCSSSERFPRYNHPWKLLETRKGRCGEWRNCFSAICVAFDYEIRLVNDFQDHVWNEVYLESQKRWFHCDCCENAFDTPLLYEAGWGKKLVYCIATSAYECQDVTMKYTRDFMGVERRRKDQCRSVWLARYLLHTTSRLQRFCSPNLRTKHLNRRLGEIASLIHIPGVEKKIKENEMYGRSSGSVDWRASRGECSSHQVQPFGYIIKFSNEKKTLHRFTYQSVADKYFIDDLMLSGWSSALFNCENVSKKVERDWKMTYLSRRENSNCSKSGTLVYKFDTRLEWTSMMVKVSTKCYGTGQVSIQLTSEPESLNLKLMPDTVNTLEKSDLKGNVEYIMVTITLSGGGGNIGWQQAQLFRRSISEQEDDFALEIVFKPKNH